jgi:hypothetical protein
METTVTKHITSKLDMGISRVDFSFIDFTEHLLLIVIASTRRFVHCRVKYIQYVASQ